MFRYLLAFSLILSFAVPASAQQGCDARMAKAHDAQMKRIAAETAKLKKTEKNKAEASVKVLSRYLGYVGALSRRADNPKHTRCALAQIRETVARARRAAGVRPHAPKKTSEMKVCLETHTGTHFTMTYKDKKSVRAVPRVCREPHTLVDIDGGKLETGEMVAIKTRYGTYWSAQPNGRLEANRPKLDKWETFRIVKRGGSRGREIGFGDKFALQGAHKKFVAANRGRVMANAPKPVSQSVFSLAKPGAKVERPTPPTAKGVVLLDRPTPLRPKRVIAPPQKIRHGTSFGYEFWIQPRGKRGGWSSILHKGRNDKERGPAIFFHPKSNRLHVRIGTDKSWNDGCDGKRELPRGRWTHVFVQFRPGVAEVYVNGRPENRCRIGKRIRPNRGPLYAGNPWHAPAAAVIRGVKLYPRPLNRAQIVKLRASGPGS